jgi:hypothetical protein
VVGATAVRVCGTAARAATALKDGVRDPGRRIVYSGPVLFNLTVTFLVVRSFTDKPNRSNSIEHQLSVVKRRTEETLNHVRSQQNIVKVKWPGKNRVTY